jgi:hypothetical protein
LFVYKRDEKGIIMIDKTEAQVIRKIFELHKDGKTQQSIGYILKNENAVQRKSGKGWTQVQVGRQLKLENPYRVCAKAEVYGGFVFPIILK